MSSSLFWRPAFPPPPHDHLPYPLKRYLGRRLWDHDGSLHGDEMEVGEELVPYLEGLADAGVDGAAELIKHIRAYGSVVVWIAG